MNQVRKKVAGQGLMLAASSASGSIFPSARRHSIVGLRPFHVSIIIQALTENVLVLRS
jgi:hypothetical protein